MIVSTASQVYTVGCGSPFVSLFPHWHRLPRIALTPAAPTLPVTRKTGPKAAATPTPGAERCADVASERGDDGDDGGLGWRTKDSTAESERTDEAVRNAREGSCNLPMGGGAGADVKFAVEHGLAGLTTYLDVWKRELQVEMASMTRAIESLGTRLDRMERKTDAIVGRAGGDVAAAKK